MSTINFCETKEQLNHLGEVVTGKTNGSPSGADIETSTLPYTGQVRNTLPALEELYLGEINEFIQESNQVITDKTAEFDTSIANKEAEASAAIDSYRLLSKGDYSSGILLSNKFEFIEYNGEAYFATNPPYTTTATLPDADGNLFISGYTTFENVANKIGNKNELSNSNFLTPSPDAITHPNATPESYVAGTQIFSGVYAGDSGCTITFIDGRVNCTAGDYQFKVPNTGGLERIPAFTSSVSDYDGIPKTTGVSHALVSDEYVVTVTPAAGDVFSVKFEQGSVATGHEVNYGVVATGSTAPRTLEDRFADVVNVKDFYLASDNGDWTRAVKLAVGNGGKVVFPYYEDITITEEIPIPSNTTLDLQGATILNNIDIDGVGVFQITSASNVTIKNGTIDVVGAGRAIEGHAVTRLRIENINFISGYLAVVIEGSYPVLSEDVRVTGCTHDGVGQGGGFFSCQDTNNVTLDGCSGKDASEFIDFNNNVTNAIVSNCISVNYTQNHWDVNSSRNVLFSNNTIISRVSGITSRPVWISGSTAGTPPIGMPNSEIISDNIVMDGNTFLISNFDYNEFLIFNSGVSQPSQDLQGYVFTNNIVKSEDAFMIDSKIAFGANPNLSSFMISGNTFINVGYIVYGTGCNISNNSHVNTKVERAGPVVRLIGVYQSSYSNNQFFNYTGQAASGPNNGVILLNACENVVASSNAIMSTTPCAEIITSTASSGEQGNQYIENRFNMDITGSSFGAVRSNSSRDTVVYNGATA